MSFPKLFSILLTIFAYSAVGFGQNLFIKAVRVNTPPIIDGQLNDACWQSIPYSSGFVTLYQRQPTRFETQVKCVYDKANLYFAFHCREKKGDIRKRAKKHDDAIYYDSCIELFLIPFPKPAKLRGLPPSQQYFHLIFNTIGTKYEQRGTWSPADWNPEWKVSVRVKPEYWEAEVAIPFSSLGVAEPKDMDVWQIQIARSSYDKNTVEYSTLFPSKGVYRNQEYFGSLVFVTDSKRKGILRKLDWQKIFKPMLAKIDDKLKAIECDGSSDVNRRLNLLKSEYRRLISKIKKLGDSEYLKSRKKLIDECAALNNKIKSFHIDMLVSELNRRNLKLALTPHIAITDSQKVLPSYIPAVKLLGKPVCITLARNEFEPATFVIWSPVPLHNVLCKVSNLKSQNSELSESVVDVRWVKCWYQAGSKEIEITSRELTPELLLKNWELIKVDYKNEKNILGYDKNHIPTRKERPDDAKALQPIRNLPAHFAQQVWLTVNVPEQTACGKYFGKIEVLADGSAVGTISIEINVLDFRLRKAIIESGLYANTRWGPRWKAKSLELAFTEMKNLAEHGVTLVGLREYADDLKVIVPLMRKAGLRIDPLYISNCSIPQPVRSTAHNIKAFQKANPPVAVRKRAERWVQVTKQLGINVVYLYLLDEAKGNLLAAERLAAQAIHSAGAKTWVACSHNFFNYGGDFIDVAVVAGGPDRKLAAKVHKAGIKIFSYANPQAGIECPETYRRNFGLLLWQKDYDGAMDFGYDWPMGKDPYNDFDHPRWKDHLMVYPTRSGVIDTIQWEGWREGVDDCRYIATLIYWSKQAKEAGNADIAKKALQWVRKLKTMPLVNLQDIRTKMIEYIEKCRNSVRSVSTARNFPTTEKISSTVESRSDIVKQ